MDAICGIKQKAHGNGRSLPPIFMQGVVVGVASTRGVDSCRDSGALITAENRPGGTEYLFFGIAKRENTLIGLVPDKSSTSGHRPFQIIAIALDQTAATTRRVAVRSDFKRALRDSCRRFCW